MQVWIEGTFPVECSKLTRPGNGDKQPGAGTKTGRKMRRRIQYISRYAKSAKPQWHKDSTNQQGLELLILSTLDGSKNLAVAHPRGARLEASEGEGRKWMKLRDDTVQCGKPCGQNEPTCLFAGRGGVGEMDWKAGIRPTTD